MGNSVKKKEFTAFDEMAIIRALDSLERASAIDIHPKSVVMHPDFFSKWVSDKHPEFFPATQELKFGRVPLKISTQVETWGILTEPYNI